MNAKRLPLSAFLKSSDAWVQPEPQETYKQITARLWGKGLTLRAKVLGSRIAASWQMRASAGQFLLSRIDARHGAFGLVPDDLDGALVSSDFPCFDINADIVIPRYLEWCSRTGAFIDLCRRASEGSTNRVRLKVSRFLRMEISIPSLEEQRRVVERLSRVAELLHERHLAVGVAEREMQTMLRKAFEQAVDGAPYRPMAEVAPLVRRSVEIEPIQEYTEIGVRSFYNGIFHRRTLVGSEFRWQDLFWIREGDLVFSNLMAWEQAIGIAARPDDGCVGNHRMLTCEVNPSLATPAFLMAYFKTREGFARVVGHSPGSIARNKTLSSKKLPTIEVPVPDIERQLWFQSMQTKARSVKETREQTAKEIRSLVPALLNEVFAASK